MQKFVSLLLLTAGLILECYWAIGQNRWSKPYFGNLDTPIHTLVESYDKGYLMQGKYGSNYSKYNWLTKTDVNGEVLWEKTIGDGIHPIAILDMKHDGEGNTYLAGGTNAYDPDGDPVIIKLNACIEKEWCRIFYTENHYSFARCLTLTPDGGIAVTLFQSNPDPLVDRICLAKLSSAGELIWKQCYTTVDISQRGEDIWDAIVTPDQGFLLTGFCYYEDPTFPNLWWLHPYFLKVDSLGNFEWETVVYKETNLHGGIAVSTVVSPNMQYYYSSISHYYYDTILASPALVKLDLEGNVMDVYDVVYGYKEGKLNYAQFINDSTLAASAGWGNSDEDLWSRAVIIDTLGNLINSTVIMEDQFVSLLQIAYDGKLVYASETYQNNQFDFYLTKLNQNLEDDTLYTRPFTYDSLCPYQIVSDTIVQDDCGLIVGVDENDGGEAGKQEGMEAWGHGGMEIWPNPCREVLNVKCLGLSSGQACLLSVLDIFGQEVPLSSLEEGQSGSWAIDVTSFPPGVYFVLVKDDVKHISSGKFVKVR